MNYITKDKAALFSSLLICFWQVYGDWGHCCSPFLDVSITCSVFLSLWFCCTFKLSSSASAVVLGFSASVANLGSLIHAALHFGTIIAERCTLKLWKCDSSGNITNGNIETRTVWQVLLGTLKGQYHNINNTSPERWTLMEHSIFILCFFKTSIMLDNHTSPYDLTHCRH